MRLKEGEVYVMGTTGFSGEVTLGVAPLTPGEMKITATGHNYRAFLGTVDVQGIQRPFAYCSAVAVMDTLQGNGDGVLNPGESTGLGVSITNSGGWALSAGKESPLRVRVSSLSPHVTVPDDTAQLETSIHPGDSAWVFFRVAAGVDVSDETVVPSV